MAQVNVDELGRPWTISGGGPIVVIPAELAAQWRGVLAPVGAVVPPGWTWGDAGGPECDYDRACDPPVKTVTGYAGFGWVAVGDQSVLILDAEIPTFFEATATGGYLVRHGAHPDEADADPTHVPEEAWHQLGDVEAITLVDGRLFMFDAAGTGAADPAEAHANDGVGVITLGPGRYRIEVATTPQEMDFVRFTRA